MDVGVAFLLDAVLHEVLTVVVIANFVWNLSACFSVSNLDREGVATGLAVLTFIVTGLNNELNWLTNCLLLQHTLTVAKRLVGTGVKEVSVVNECGGELWSKNRKLDSALFWSKLNKAWGDSGHFGLTDENTWHIDSVLGAAVSWDFTHGKVNTNRVVLETLTLNVDWNTTSELTEWWVNISDSV